jgi:hypothetical protein
MSRPLGSLSGAERDVLMNEVTEPILQRLGDLLGVDFNEWLMLQCNGIRNTFALQTRSFFKHLCARFPSTTLSDMLMMNWQHAPKFQRAIQVLDLPSNGCIDVSPVCVIQPLRPKLTLDEHVEKFSALSTSNGCTYIHRARNYAARRTNAILILCYFFS